MFENIGKINSYVNMQNMQKIVLKKVKDNDFFNTTQDKISSAEQSQNATPDSKLELITCKLRGGKKLSSVELNYLREKAPELYSKAIRIEEERKEFAEKLKTCKSKVEARSLHATNISFATLSGKTDNTGEAEYCSMTNAAINNKWNEFTATKNYKKLPEQKAKEKEKTNEKKGISIQV